MVVLHHVFFLVFASRMLMFVYCLATYDKYNNHCLAPHTWTRSYSCMEVFLHGNNNETQHFVSFARPGSARLHAVDEMCFLYCVGSLLLRNAIASSATFMTKDRSKGKKLCCCLSLQRKLQSLDETTTSIRNLLNACGANGIE